MWHHVRERFAVARVAAKRSVVPTYDMDHYKLTEGVRAVLAIEAIEWHPEGVSPIDNT